MKPRESPRRPLREIYFYLTEECNLRCRHCWISPLFQGSALSHRFLEPQLFASIVDQAVPLGLVGIKLSGGEPLLHPAIVEIIQAVKARGLGITLETNGVLCTEQLARTLATARPESLFPSVLTGLTQKRTSGCEVSEGALKPLWKGCTIWWKPD